VNWYHQLTIKNPQLVECAGHLVNTLLNLSIGGGAEGIRTPVQTHSPKAFYMLISLLIVGIMQEKNKPT
jgi:hypothetical protein